MDNINGTFGLHFRHAGILDIPFVFSLMTDSAMNDGSFADTLLTGPGYGALLIALIKALHFLQRWQRRKNACHDLWVVEVEDTCVGFLHCIRSASQHGAPQVHIQGCAIAPAYRNKGYGNKILAWVIQREADSKPVITAYCNGYAKAMQHIFKRHRFVRQSIGRGMERYVLQLEDKRATSQART